MKYIVDRIEDNIVVLENKNKIIKVEKILLPKNIKEGSIITKGKINTKLEIKRRKKIRTKFNKLKKQ